METNVNSTLPTWNVGSLVSAQNFPTRTECGTQTQAKFTADETQDLTTDVT